MNLPEFVDGHLKRLLVCAYIESQDLLALLNKFEDKRFDYDAKYSSDHWVHLIIEESERDNDIKGKIHFHIEVKDSFGKDKAPPTSTIDELLDTASSFYGLKGRAWIKANYEIPEKEFGKSSIVNAFLGLQTESSGTRMLIDGMHLDVQDDQFDDIEWWQKSDGNIVVAIDAFVPVDINDDTMTKANDFLRDGVKRFILGEKIVKESGNDSNE
ncbi:hypothetical protein Pan153_23530 [Gimesia panareensis]|uniref:Uncharacterized protein n=1 Tax=Gimesia panareensis TaxID=2527978 RepID=A0A518FMZ2_9PLAN|nr:hypothetical protein [Gimesia panareensis]QDV17699.1 hypothetical protein Pan153_23530 [Gimesia panareensis]